MRYKEEMVDAIIQELELSKEYLPQKSLETVYFGGGTPSVLSREELDRIFRKIESIYQIAPNAEITLEANPDDLTPEKVRELANSPVNRLSIGIQSLWEEDLKWMNRAHTAKEALVCLDHVQQAGFSDISIDLIYGTPSLSDEQWVFNLEEMIRRAVPHISSYCLTVEPGTALGNWVEKGKVKPMDEEKAERHFDLLTKYLLDADYEHYEISNFALPGRYARHNTAYWQRKPYLGVGPSAHSFNGTTRQWNIAHNAKYLKEIQQGQIPSTIEALSKEDQFNEYVMTALRTQWGVDPQVIDSMGSPFVTHFQTELQALVQDGYIQEKEGFYTLTAQAKFQADGIASSLFMV